MSPPPPADARGAMPAASPKGAAAPAPGDSQARSFEEEENKAILGGVWLLWAGVGLQATLASEGVHWVIIQLSGFAFYAPWIYYNVDPRRVMRSFFFLCTKFFFKNFDVAGVSRVPSTGPVILACAPHGNQFVDGLVVLRSCAHRDLGFVTAAVTLRRKWVGAMTRTVGAIPVERPQDLKRAGVGTITAEKGSLVVTGIGTSFLKDLKKGDVVRVKKPACDITVSVVRSDTELETREPVAEDLGGGPRGPVAGAGHKYMVLPHVDQSVMFQASYDYLGAGGVMGIFPEGGSHDRTQLLEVKPGLTIMALGAMQKYPGLKVKIVPLGLNYFKGHRFRSRVFVDIGEPIVPTDDQLARFCQGGEIRRAACRELLEKLAQGLNAVTVQAPDYDSLQFFRLMRRLYLPPANPESTSQRFTLMKAFADRYPELKDKPDVKALYQGVLLYRRILRSHNIPDHVVATRTIGNVSAEMAPELKMKYLLHNVASMVALACVSIPGICMSLPMLVITRVISRRKALEAVRNSSVKLTGRDVMATWKILVSFVMIPLLHFCYTTFAWVRWGRTAAIAYFFAAPFISSFTILFTERLVNLARDSRLLFQTLWNESSGQWLWEYREDLRRRTQQVVSEYDWDHALTASPSLYRQGEHWNEEDSPERGDGHYDFVPAMRRTMSTDIIFASRHETGEEKPHNA